MDLSATYLKHIIGCINKQCVQTKEHTDAARSYFSNNRNSAGLSLPVKELTFSMSAKSAQGAYFHSIDDKIYLDITMGFGVHLFGHKAAFIEKAISDQLQRGIAIGPLYQEAAEAAELIHEMTGNDRCAFYNSGTEAVMVAMRIARAATGKKKVVIFEGAYHGTHDSLLAVKSHPVHKTAISTVPGIAQHFTDETILLEFGKTESLEFIRKHAGEIAAVLTEPVQSRHPESYHPQFLTTLGEITQEQDIIFILDEIITGFRVANGGAATHFNLRPDLTTYGKVAGGGLPIGIVAGKKKLMDYIDGGNWRFGDDSMPSSPTTFVAGTFCHHPLAMAATKATLQYLSDHSGSIQTALNHTTSAFCTELNIWFGEEGYPVSMLHFGSLFRFQLKGKSKILYHALLKEGVYIWEGRNCFLSTAHDEQVIAALTNKIKKAVRELAAAGCFPQAHKPAAVANNIYIHAAVKLEGKLDKASLELAARYLCECIPALKHPGHSFRNISIAEKQDFNEQIATYVPVTAFDMLCMQKEDVCVIYVSASKNICDGWSLILFMRELAKCYSAIIDQIPMPEPAIVSDACFVRWLQADARLPAMNQAANPLTNAACLHREIDLNRLKHKHNGHLFKHLFAKFRKSVAGLSQEIAIPVAGQLVSRNPRSFGACSTQISLSSSAEDIELVTGELKDPLRFRDAFLTKKNPASIVFNYDDLNWRLNFGGLHASYFAVEENKTAHGLVCNISRLPDKLVVTLKYATQNYSAPEAEKIMATIAENIQE